MGRYTKHILTTIASLAFSEIVFVFSEAEVYQPSRSPLVCTMRELYSIKEFKAVFCLEAMEGKLPALAQNTAEAVEAGLCDFLLQPPLVFSRTVGRGYFYFQSRRIEIYEDNRYH